MLHNTIDTRLRSPWWKGNIPLIVGAFCAGICLMAFHNRAELGLIVRQFSALWPIAQNRLEILRVSFRIILTGIVFAAIAWACCLTASALKSYRQDEPEESAEGTLMPSHTAVTLRSSQPTSNSPLLSKGISLVQQTVQSHVELQLPLTPYPDMHVVSAMNTQRKEELGDTRGTVYEDRGMIPETPVEDIPNEEPRDASDQQSIYITITLLKSITMTLHVPGKLYPIEIDDLNPKAQQLIAYIAWQQGKKVNLGEMRDQIFGNDELDASQVQELLNSAKREIRRRIAAATERARSDFGQDILPANLDIFELAKKRYWLSVHCRVTDLAVIEEQHRLIEEAENGNQLINSVPDQIYAACTRLIEAYTGDFIEDLLVDEPYAFDPATDSWAREPFTHYRDSYLQAIFYAAEYKRKQGDDTKAPAEQREHYAEAARLFAIGAMAACNRRVFDGRFDTKVSFSSKPGRRHGAHVLLSEQLIRRAIVLYGKIEDTILAKRVYATYEQQMYEVSNRVWSPDPETLKDLEATMQRTGAYRFTGTIASPQELSSIPLNTKSA